MKRKTTDIQIIEAAKEVYSISSLLKKVGLRQAGGNFASMKRTLQRLGIDTSHWKGQGWNKGEQLKDWSDYTKVSSLKKHLILLRGYNCEWCGLSTWRDKHITLEADHVDGNRTNNALGNLRLLCPNCHSQTDTFRSKNQNRNFSGVQ